MAAFGRPPDEYPPEQSKQGGLRPPAEPPQADKTTIGSMARGALSCLVVARWGLHGSNWAPRDALLFFLKPTWQQLGSEGGHFCVPRLLVGARMGVIGAHWGLLDAFFQPRRLSILLRKLDFGLKSILFYLWLYKLFIELF